MSPSVIPSDISSWKVIYCALLSLILHAGLLAGLQMIQRAEPREETVPLVHVTLVPTPVPADPLPSNEQTEESVTPPPMRQMPRPATTRSPISTPPIVKQSQPIKPVPALAFTPEPLAKNRPQRPHRQRVLRDTKAAEALFAQQATRMVKSSTVTDSEPASASQLPTLSVANIPRTYALPSTVPSIHAAPATSRSTRPRRLLAARPTSSGPGLAKVGVRHSVRPVYPRLAKEEGWEGTVLLKVLVRINGKPDNITIQQSSGHKILDDSAMEAIRQWRFTPAMDGNFPVEKYLHVPLKFGLQQ